MEPDPNKNVSEAHTSFQEALDNFAVGMLTLDAMKAAVVQSMQTDPESATTIKDCLDEALTNGLIKSSSFDVLSEQLSSSISEDEPTEWSEETRHVQEATDADDALDGDAPGLSAGSVLNGRYELVAHIGAGNMADVYKALDWEETQADEHNPWVAIKVLSAEFAKHPAALESLQHEARNSQSLDHPNIVRVHNCSSDGEHFFLIMEHLVGESLVQVLNDLQFKPMPEDQAARTIEGLCQALTYAHENGIVHADLKPGNVFITKDGAAKLLDFGIARVTASGALDSGSTIKGAYTPGYASCEILEGFEPTIHDDIYSLACIIYRILSGRRVFGRVTALDAEKRGLSPKPIPGLSSDQWLILKSALQFRRQNRLGTVTEILNAFTQDTIEQEVIDVEEFDVDPDATDEFLAFEQPQRNFNIIIPAAAAVVAAITLAVFWPRSDQSDVNSVVSVPEPLADTRAPSPWDDETALEQEIIGDEMQIDGSLPEPFANMDSESVITESDLADPVVDTAQQTVSDAISREDQISQPETVGPELAELAMQADQAISNGQLTGSGNNNAQAIVGRMEELAPQSAEFRQARARLSESMLLEAMVEISAENYGQADEWIAQARALEGSRTSIQRVETALSKARASRVEEKPEESLELFASAMPAAILDRSTETDSATNVKNAGELPAVSNLAPLALVLPDSAQSNAGGQVDIEAELNNEIPLSQLEFTRFVEPRYPRRISTQRMSGWVEVEFDILANGRTSNIRVIGAEPANRFESAAVNAVERWRFEPIVVNGEAVERSSGVKLRFEPN